MPEAALHCGCNHADQGDRYWLPASSAGHQLLGRWKTSWLELVSRKYLGMPDQSAGIAELCETFDTVDVWIDPDPNAQLILVWLLHCFRAHHDVVSKLNLVQADISIGELMPERLLTRQWPAVKIVNNHLELASSAWRAYRAPTPQPWFDSAIEGFERAAAAPAGGRRFARGVAGMFDRAWRHGNAYAGIDRGR